MKISKKVGYIIVIIVGVLLIAASWYFGMRTFNEKTDEIEAENSKLLTEINTLQPLQNNESQYKADTKDMIAAGEDIEQYFPAAVQAEDQILYDVKIEDQIGCYISYLGTPETGYVNIPTVAQENVLSSLTDVTGAIEAHSTTDPENMLDVSGMLLGEASSANLFTCTYDQIKDVINYVCSDKMLKSVDNLSLSYDSSTGFLTGSIQINYYSMTGTGAAYTEPSTNVSGHGVDTIFGTLAELPEAE